MVKKALDKSKQTKKKVVVAESDEEDSGSD
jgi:hypothetical protein